jgi:hypothetical protein
MPPSESDLDSYGLDWSDYSTDLRRGAVFTVTRYPYEGFDSESRLDIGWVTIEPGGYTLHKVYLGTPAEHDQFIPLVQANASRDQIACDIAYEEMQANGDI